MLAATVLFYGLFYATCNWYARCVCGEEKIRHTKWEKDDENPICFRYFNKLQLKPRIYQSIFALGLNIFHTCLMPKKVLLSNIKKVFLKVPNSIFQSSMIFLIPNLQKGFKLF